jgi:transglutaminase-like putative cysteine protease
MRSFLIATVALLISSCARSTPVRTVLYKETIHIAAQDAPVRLWIPVPQSDNNQQARLLGIEANAKHRFTREIQFGNDMLYVEGPAKTPLEIEVRYEVRRSLRRGGDGPKQLPKEQQLLFTQPRGLVAVNDRVRALAHKHGGPGAPLQQARGFYDYILAFMAYDKKTPGWGRGDSLRACVVGLGNCTDFHSLFQSLAGVKDIPSRFRMGLPLSDKPVNVFEGKGYHCWVDFHAAGKGWYPVDISEAWKVKHGKKKMAASWVERYFGTVDEARILLSSGRNITLVPSQSGPPRNYFAYPYAESQGKQIKQVSFTRTLTDQQSQS